MQQKKVRKVSSKAQKDAPSSSANKTPPIGAPKALATPAAAPHEMKSRFSISLRNRSNRNIFGPGIPQNFDLP